ncbi:MAG: methyl-accepting chemotaxis protein [Acidovorax sp.]|uniref:methyl-accepting chemotaxis protein n=1 Tax=Acidovorax sp. TaxID=1872122 RepID=UPI00391D669B
MTVRTKLGLAFGLMVTLILLVAGIAIYGMKKSHEQFHDYISGINASAHLAKDVESAVNRRAIAARNLVIATKESDRAAEKLAVTAAHADVQGRLARLKDLADAAHLPAHIKALVASEVRNLAQRSASAAKEIKVLISESVQKVAMGTSLVDQAGQTMVEVVDAIKRVSDVVGEISSASSEQSSGVSQIGQAVNQMDQATQQNAALVEESAAAAQSLDTQAKQLTQAVQIFKLDGLAGAARLGVTQRPTLGYAA